MTWTWTRAGPREWRVVRSPERQAEVDALEALVSRHADAMAKRALGRLSPEEMARMMRDRGMSEALAQFLALRQMRKGRCPDAP